MRRKVFSLLILLLFSRNIFPADKIQIKLVASFHLDQTNQPIGRVYDIAVDDNENIYVPDGSFANIKIFNDKGRLLKIFGKKGAGPGEFIDPARIDIEGNRIAVQDVGQLKYLIFDREFNEIKRFFYLLSGQSFILDGERIITNEYFRDKNEKEFRGVILDLSGRVLKGLIQIKRQGQDVWSIVSDAFAYIDSSKEGKIYFVKSGRVFFYIFTKEGNFIKNFGVPPSFFIAPKRTKDFDEMVKWGRAPQGREAAKRWYSSSSWVSGIFVFEDFLGIPIRTFEPDENIWKCLLQFYDLEGNLLEEGIELPEVRSSSHTGFFVESNHRDKIYILKEIEGDEIQYNFYKYEVKR